jgi:hypothetical protein
MDDALDVTLKRRDAWLHPPSLAPLASLASWRLTLSVDASARRVVDARSMFLGRCLGGSEINHSKTAFTRQNLLFKRLSVTTSKLFGLPVSFLSALVRLCSVTNQSVLIPLSCCART